MKKLIPLLFCFVAANAFASSADSGVCPWKLPFTIKIHANGTVHMYEHDVYTHGPSQDFDHGTANETDDLEIIVDTSKNLDRDSSVVYSLTSDSLRFNSQTDSTYVSVLIVFARGNDSITYFSMQRSYVSIENNGWYEQDRYLNFQMSSILFDSSSIFTTDTSMRDHDISMTDFEKTSYFSEEVHMFGDFYDTDFTATSVILSGIFRTTTFSDPPAIVSTPPSNNLTVFNSNGSIACLFDRSEHERNLEVYSPLGIKVASEVIPPNENNAFLSRLSPGFYFIRLEGDVRKLYIPY